MITVEGFLYCQACHSLGRDIYWKVEVREYGYADRIICRCPVCSCISPPLPLLLIPPDVMDAMAQAYTPEQWPEAQPA